MGAGIFLDSGSVAGSITNKSGGLIEGLGYTTGIGIAVEGGTINSGIDNTGTIRGCSANFNSRCGVSDSYTYTGYGIALLSSATVTGGITNHGDIKGMAAGESGYGILVSASSVVTGDITNTGTIEGIAGSDSDYSAFGIKFENGATLNGTINNSGMIRGIACDRYYY